jgi:sterol desaturase/sphingolipid hydroxylase (fatty acid hydroxylase superfamily)
LSFFGSLAANVVAAWQAFGSVAVILWGIERLFPKGSVSAESQLRAAKYWLFAGVGSGLAFTIYGHIADTLQPQPLFVIPLNRWFAHPWIHWSLYVITPMIGVILYDFFDYWMHRAQHRWFWNFHSIHHSIEELSGINSYFHWTEQLFRVVFIIMPAAYIVGIDSIKTAALAELLVRVQGYYLHSPTRIHVGPVLRRLIADNRFHRIHHSIHPQHFDKNFGAGTSIWDQLFGTAYFPTEDEWPQTGMIEQSEASTLGHYLWGPFKPQGKNRKGKYLTMIS